MVPIIKKYPLISFVVLTYAISWSFLYPSFQMILANDGITPLALIGLIGAFGPTISAIIVTKIAEGKEALKSLLRKYLIFKVNYKYYLFVLFVPVLLQIAGILLSKIFGYSLGEFNLASGLKGYIPYLLITIPFGPLAEELGWRGYLLPKLLKKFGVIKASLLVGFIWSLWHLAAFSFPGAAIPAEFEVDLWSLSFYFLQLIALSLIFTYVFLRTRGSVFIAIILHAAFNANENIAFSFFNGVGDNMNQLRFLFVTYIVLMFLLSVSLLYNFKRWHIKSLN
ncbi:MAG: type II CAAX endopeptidase family protein [Bacteroidota bacterium]